VTGRPALRRSATAALLLGPATALLSGSLQPFVHGRAEAPIEAAR
jgi:hypothetical protein